MSEIIKFIITYIIYFLVCLAAMLPIALFHTRQIEKLIDNFFNEVKESYAARLQSLKEVHAQVDEFDESADEIGESFDEIHEDTDEIHESFDEMHESLHEIGKSLDRMNESTDRTIEFKRLISEYLDNKIKRIEARENFCESQFWNEKIYTKPQNSTWK